MGMDLSTTGSVSWEYLIKLEKRHKVFEKDGEKEDRSFLIWHWGFSEEGFEDVTITSVSSAPPWGPKAKARKWAGAILRRTLGDDEKFNEDDLKGKPVILNIVLKETDRGTFAEVDSLSQVRSNKGSKQKGSKEAEAAEVEKHLDDQEEKAS
jgi:hypothetical protein